MEFLTSKKETKRRRYAFLTLISSFYIGLVIFSKLISFHISITSYILILVLLTIFYFLTSIYLNYLSKSKIIIQDGYIERKNDENTERYLISKIRSIGIKRRKNSNIREISIFFSNNKKIYLNALEEHFESIKEILLKSINKEIAVNERKELIDYDSIIFYPILGLAISFVSILVYSKVALMDYSQAKMLFPIFSIYLFSLGIYFLIKKPIAIGSGKNIVIADVIFGITMIAASILISIIFVFNQ